MGNSPLERELDLGLLGAGGIRGRVKPAPADAKIGRAVWFAASLLPVTPSARETHSRGWKNPRNCSTYESPAPI